MKLGQPVNAIARLFDGILRVSHPKLPNLNLDSELATFTKIMKIFIQVEDAVFFMILRFYTNSPAQTRLVAIAKSPFFPVFFLAPYLGT
jgi:hypothetical protein